MPKQWRLAFAFFLAFLLVSLSGVRGVRADDAPMHASGFDLRPGDPDTQIVLDAENVEVEVEDDPAVQLPLARVRATFRLRNTGGDVRQTVGFPSWESSAPYLSAMAFDSFKNLSVAVDGVSIPVYGKELPLDPQDSGTRYVWTLWDMTFVAGETKTTTVEYSYRLDAPYWGPDDVPLYHLFNYVLVTGRWWKDAIGRADISITLPASFGDPRQLFLAAPAGSVLDGRTVRWKLRDFEPDENIVVGFWTPEGLARLTSAQRAVAEDPQSADAQFALAREYAAFVRLPPGMLAKEAEWEELAVRAAEEAFRLSGDVEVLNWLGDQHEAWGGSEALRPRDGGQLEKAVTYYERALAISTQPEQEQKLRRVLAALARLPVSARDAPPDEGRLREALFFADRALGLSFPERPQGQYWSERDLLATKKAIYMNLVRLAVESGELDQGLKLARALADIRVTQQTDVAGFCWGLEDTLAGLGRALVAAGKPAAAREVFEIAVADWYYPMGAGYQDPYSVTRREAVRNEAVALLGTQYPDLFPTPTPAPTPTFVPPAAYGSYPAPLSGAYPIPYLALRSPTAAPTPPSTPSVEPVSGHQTSGRFELQLWHVAGGVLLGLGIGLVLGRRRRP